MNLFAAAVQFSAIKNSSVTALSTANGDMWNKHKEYVLGRDVRLKEIKNNQEVVVQKPTWALVLHFEQALRERAAELMNEGSRNKRE